MAPERQAVGRQAPGRQAPGRQAGLAASVEDLIIITQRGKRNLRDIAGGLPPTEPATVTLTAAAVTPGQAAAPAGGTGATAGAMDTAANRDLLITSVNAARTDIAALKAEFDKMLTDLANLKQVLVDDLGIIDV